MSCLASIFPQLPDDGFLQLYFAGEDSATLDVWLVGVGSLPYFSDDDEDSGDSSSQDDKSEGDESEDNDGDFGGLLEEQLERRTTTSKTELTFEKFTW